MIEKKTILITGGFGFIGQNLLLALKKLNYKVVVTTRNVKKNNLKTINDISIIELDFTYKVDVLEILKKVKPNIIVHLAGTIGRNETLEFVDNINFIFTKTLLEAANRINIEKIILFGSADEYGYQNSPANENFAVNPISPYAVSKTKANDFALNLFAKEQLPVVILRPFTSYGFFQPKQMFLTQAIESALLNNTFEMTDGIQTRDYIFINDIVSAVFATINTDNINGEIFNIGTGKSTALAEIARIIWNNTEANSKYLRIGARKSNISELHNTCANIEKARKMLNWNPSVSLENGLKITIDWMRNSLHERKI